jgi:renalase
MSDENSLAVIGAGLAGLTCARALADAGLRVEVFDKGRGLGGRLATRRIDGGQFDHGAATLTAERAAFGAFLESNPSACAWPEGGGWVGDPRMSALVRPLAEGLDISNAVEITGLSKDPEGWRLQTSTGDLDGRYRRLVLAIPQPQAEALLQPWPGMASAVAKAAMRPCWAALAAFSEPLSLKDPLLRFTAGPLASAIHDSAKPGRGGGLDCWVLQAREDWSREHLELEKPEAAERLLAAFFEAAEVAPRKPAHLAGHRWRYGFTERPLGEPFLFNAELGLGVCGDWCLGADAEAAYDSGRALAAAICLT